MRKSLRTGSGQSRGLWISYGTPTPLVSAIGRFGLSPSRGIRRPDRPDQPKGLVRSVRYGIAYAELRTDGQKGTGPEWSAGPEGAMAVNQASST